VKPGTYLIEDFAIGLVPVPRMLPELIGGDRSPHDKTTRDTSKSPAGPLPNSPRLLVIGNIDYNAPTGQADKTDICQLSKESLGGNLITFEGLKSAPDEMRTVQSEFRRAFPTGRLQILEQSAATEAAFRREAPQYQWLFLATHGFFAAPSVCAALAAQDEIVGLDATHGASHSGALCGLAMAGANQSHRGDDGDDGILTAYEVSALDLRKVELVVLSGCETALGENTPGEGAMSLQRAFQVAGARTTVASLWSVPDEKTKELMQQFLHNLWDNKMSKLEGLRAAQISILHATSRSAADDLPLTKSALQRTYNGSITNPVANDPVTQPNFLPPYYWAAFVLSGDWQ
jgi:CHAT domain-containing protein